MGSYLYAMRCVKIWLNSKGSRIRRTILIALSSFNQIFQAGRITLAMISTLKSKVLLESWVEHLFKMLKERSREERTVATRDKKNI
jgi:hypothetical protein